MHDVLTIAKAAAYSGILMLFPALLVLTTLLAQMPDTSNALGEIRGGLEQVLPSDTMLLVQSYLEDKHTRSAQVVLSASALSLFASLGLALSLIEGFRRAYRISRAEWSYRSRWFTALRLIPTCLMPLALASLLVVFGHQIEQWSIDNTGHELQTYVLIGWRLIRWALSLTTSVAVLSLLYYFGSHRHHHWFWTLPGALTSSIIWFPSTLLFGWYVTRFADYSVVYGSVGASIATLVWLYLTFFSILLGAEFNAELHRERLSRQQR